MSAPAALDDVRHDDEADFYPRELLAGCKSALVLFAAGFYGRQDAVWIEEAGLRGTCVDIDAVRLGRMEELYPRRWLFVTADVFAYATAATVNRQRWDVVSLDPPTHLFQQCVDFAPVWAKLARKVVILGCSPARLPEPPPGWQALPPLHRSDYRGGVCWACFKREAL